MAVLINNYIHNLLKITVTLFKVSQLVELQLSGIDTSITKERMDVKCALINDLLEGRNAKVHKQIKKRTKTRKKFKNILSKAGRTKNAFKHSRYKFRKTSKAMKIRIREHRHTRRIRGIG